MMLLRKADRDALPKLRAQDGKGDEATAYVKFFHPWSRYTLYVTEFDGDDQLYGWCVSPLGADCDEWGYSSLREIAAVEVMGCGVERDMHFRPATVRECKAAQA